MSYSTVLRSPLGTAHGVWVEGRQSDVVQTRGREASQGPQQPRGRREARLENSRGEEKTGSKSTCGPVKWKLRSRRLN